MTHQPLKVAVPWSLSHYIPLNGFHPLYRALFDQSPASVELHAWDNVKLHNRFARDIKIREAVLRAANAAKRKSRQSATGPIARAYLDYFWPPDQALTTELMGDIEFHHTAPFPSLKRPFVFHCESFAPVFLPFAQQGSGEFKNHEALREHYRRIFTNPLCLGIFSHIPETLQSLSRFFSDPGIDRKLFSSRIGLSSHAFDDPEPPKKTSLPRPKFLFVNSANQNPANFFRRGGHIVLRFWKEFKANGRDGLLMLRCAKPREKDLLDYGVDASFLRTETGRSVLWAEDYLANHEMNALMASAHFFLLPSASLHSVAIMQALTLGTIPIVTDTVGTAVYVTDDEHGIVLRGVRAAIWHTDPNTGILVDRYCRTPSLDDSLVSQMTRRILAMLDAPDAYQRMRGCAMGHARRQFTGHAFSAHFWSAVGELHQNHKRSSSGRDPFPSETARSLLDCTLRGDDWARVFESTTQPLRRIYTGKGSVWELGGAMVHSKGNPGIALNDWSVLAQYYSPGAPRISFASALHELGGKYLPSTGEQGEDAGRRLTGFISRVLTPFPKLHSFAAGVLRKLRRYCRFLAFRFTKSNMGPDVELVLHGVSGYNVIRHFHKYYAIPQSEGEFVPDKVRAGGYSSSFSGNSVEKVLRKIAVAARQTKQPAPGNGGAVRPELALEGFHGFNIIRLGDEFHAILQSEGAFEHAKVLSRKYNRSFSGRSLAEVQSAIVASIDSGQGLNESFSGSSDSPHGAT